MNLEEACADLYRGMGVEALSILQFIQSNLIHVVKYVNKPPPPCKHTCNFSSDHPPPPFEKIWIHAQGTMMGKRSRGGRIEDDLISDRLFRKKKSDIK